MGKKILAVIVSGLLILSLDLSVPASIQPGGDLPPEEETLNMREIPEKAVNPDIQSIIYAVERAAQLEHINLQSQEIADFLAASSIYDNMDEETRAGLPSQTTADMEMVRLRIGEAVHTCDGITAGSSQWYVKTNVSDGTDRENILELLKSTFQGSSPRLIYYKNISYTDIRSGEDYHHDSMISVAFPIPEGYEDMENPYIFTVSRGKTVRLMPKEDGAGNFYLGSARTLSSVIIADLPISLSGISVEKEAGLNVGQTYAVKAAPVPADTTQPYTLVWESSNPKVAQVDPQGIVTGIAPGTAWITASVEGRGELKNTCMVTVVQGAVSLGTKAWEVLEETRAYIRSIDKNPTIGSEWHIIGLARGGMDLGEPYFSTYYNHFANYLEEKKGKLTSSVKYTEYSKAIVAMTAMGKDARNVAGYNLLESLADFENVAAQGVNGPIWALIALNANPQYTIPETAGVQNQTTREKLLEYILDNETPAGGWDLMGLAPDSDMTGMALQALAPFYKKSGYEDVTAAVDRGLEALSRIQDSDGGYSTMGSKTVESCAQVVTALCALGIDPETDSRFIKGGSWTVEKLLSYHIPGSGFMHVKAGEANNGGGAAGEVNGMATEQGHYALVAYQRLKQGKTGLYDMSDLTVHEGGKGDGSGTGLEVSSPTPVNTPSPKPGSTQPSGSSVSGGNGQNQTVQGIGNGGGASTVSGAGAGRLAYAGPAPSAVPSVSKNASSDSVSANRKKVGKTQKEEGGSGWNFEGAAYEETEHDWDFQGESIDTGGLDIEERGNEKTENRRQIPPLAAGAAGGILGTAALEGGRYLWKYRRRKLGGMTG